MEVSLDPGKVRLGVWGRLKVAAPLGLLFISQWKLFWQPYEFFIHSKSIQQASAVC